MAREQETAAVLVMQGVDRFGQLERQLTREIATLGRGISFQAAVEQRATVDEPRLAMIRETGHVASFDDYNCLMDLTLQTHRTDTLALSFHALGPRFRGLIGVIAYILQSGQPVLLETGDFLINYEEPLESARTRFSNWLERVLVAGLDRWRRTL